MSASDAKASAFFRQRAFAMGYVLPFLVCKRPRPLRGRVQAFTKNGRALYGAAPSAPSSKEENEGRRRKKKCKPVRGRYGMWPAARRAICAALGEMNGGMKQKQYTAPRRFKCVFWLYFFVFSLDGTLFPAYNAYYVSSWPCVPMCQKYAENICAFRRFLPRQKGRLTRCYEEAEHAEKIRSGRKLW